MFATAAIALLRLGPSADAPEILWDAPTECPQRDDVEVRIEARLGRPLKAGELQAEGKVRAEDGGFVLDLTTRIDDAEEQRSLRADSCDALADVTALVVALALDPVAVTGRIKASESEGQAHRPRPPIVEPEPPAVFDPEPPEEVTRPQYEYKRDRAGAPALRAGAFRGLIVRGLAGGELGSLPSATGSFGLDLAVQWQRALFEVGGRYAYPQRTDLSATGARLRVQLGSAFARGCGRLGRDRLAIPLCFGFEGGAVRARSSGTDAPATTYGPWFGLQAGVAISWWIVPQFGLYTGVEAVAILIRPRFELEPVAGEDPASLFVSAPVAGRLLGGLQVRIGGGRDGTRSSRRR